MLKSLASKIFISFAALVLVEAGSLAIIFGKSEIRLVETYILESLSRRLDTKVAKLTTDPTTPFITDGNSTRAEVLPANFDRIKLLNLLPPSGSNLTACSDRTGKSFYCGFAYVAESHGWVFDWVGQETLWEAVARRLNEVIPIIFGLLFLALLLTFLLSRFLLAPLRRFSVASESIAQGNYENLDLPTQRTDELGDLALAFKKMIVDLKDRETNLQISGLKLAHSARLASIGQMGASIAHEVKNPLTSMMGYARILANKASDPETKEAAEIILKESERCNQILQQMLRFARNDPAESKPYPLKEVVQSVALLLKAEARTRQIELRLEHLEDTIVIGSAQQIQQVLINLVVNAFHASKAGSFVTIRMKEADGCVKVEVCDQGSGIPKEIQAKIFDPFFTTKAKDGTGLGLSVAQEIVHQQGGSLSFESEEGKGTAFQISLKLP